MKIGIFDSGLGGLVIAHSLMSAVPDYDYVYFGDMAHVPYGDRSQEDIYEFTREGVTYLFEQDCQLVILACNSASAEALRKLQREYLPRYYPDRKLLGVLVPAAEEVGRVTQGRVGVLATEATVESNAFVKEIRKCFPEAEVFQQAAPKLVPLIEAGNSDTIESALHEYIAPLLQKQIDTLVLGCTHYPIIKDVVRRLSPGVRVVSQDEIIPVSLREYLARHSEIEEKLSRGKTRAFYVSQLSNVNDRVVLELFGEGVNLEKVDMEARIKTDFEQYGKRYIHFFADTFTPETADTHTDFATQPHYTAVARIEGPVRSRLIGVMERFRSLDSSLILTEPGLLHMTVSNVVDDGWEKLRDCVERYVATEPTFRIAGLIMDGAFVVAAWPDDPQSLLALRRNVALAYGQEFRERLRDRNGWVTLVRFKNKPTQPVIDLARSILDDDYGMVTLRHVAIYLPQYRTLDDSEVVWEN